MAGVNSLHASTTVSYRDNILAKRLIIEGDSDPSLPKEKGTSHVRVFPTAAHPVVTAVMGAAVLVASGLPEEVIDYVSFSGSATSSLRYPPASAVVIQSSKFFKETPTAVQPTVAYDAESNSLVLDKEAHGIVKVTYTAYFDRYKVTHGDAPCALAVKQTEGLEVGEPTPPKPKQAPNYDPAFLVATASGWETASLEVSGPPCNQGDDGYIQTQQFSDYSPVGIKLEIDTEYPPNLYPYYFDAANVSSGFTMKPQAVVIGGVMMHLYCGCRIRVYPKTGVTLQGVNCAVGTSIVGSGVRPVLQTLTFSGTQSLNLDYPPQGSISLSGNASAISLFNEEISVDFLGPGEWVNEVVWKTRTTYEITQGNRIVRPDEVVAATVTGSNTIPCYTFAQAHYTSDYYLYDMLFSWDESIGWYAPAMILAVASDGRRGHIQIDPPGKGGVL